MTEAEVRLIKEHEAFKKRKAVLKFARSSIRMPRHTGYSTFPTRRCRFGQQAVANEFLSSYNYLSA